MSKEFKKSDEIILLEKEIKEMEDKLRDMKRQLKEKSIMEFEKQHGLIPEKTILKYREKEFVYIIPDNTEYAWIMAKKIIKDGSLSKIKHCIIGDWEKTGEEYTPVKSKVCIKKA